METAMLWGAIAVVMLVGAVPLFLAVALWRKSTCVVCRAKGERCERCRLLDHASRV